MTRAAGRSGTLDSVEVWTKRGLQRFLVPFFLDLSTRRVEIAGVASTANGLWMTPIGRTVTDAVDGILRDKRYVICDRDPLYKTDFLSLLRGIGEETDRPQTGPSGKHRSGPATEAIRRLAELLLSCSRLSY